MEALILQSLNNLRKASECVDVFQPNSSLSKGFLFTVTVVPHVGLFLKFHVCVAYVERAKF